MANLTNFTIPVGANVTVGPGNFNQDNTPNWLKVVGNYCLLIGSLGAAVALAPIATPTIAAIGAWCAFAGGLGKIISKLTGEKAE
jgi:hypothetical protein